MWLKKDGDGYLSLCERFRDANGKRRIRHVIFLGRHRTVEGALAAVERDIAEGVAEETRLREQQRRMPKRTLGHYSLVKLTGLLERLRARRQKLRAFLDARAPQLS